MPSEWARKRAEELSASEWAWKRAEELSACREPWAIEQFAAALDEAEKRGAERERWECWRILYSRNFPAWISTNPQYKALEWGAKAIAARGPMRGPEEE